MEVQVAPDPDRELVDDALLTIHARDTLGRVVIVLLLALLLPRIAQLHVATDPLAQLRRHLSTGHEGLHLVHVAHILLARRIEREEHRRDRTHDTAEECRAGGHGPDGHPCLRRQPWLVGAVANTEHLRKRRKDRPRVLDANVRVLDTLLRHPAVVRVGARSDQEEHACVPVGEKEEHQDQLEDAAHARAELLRDVAGVAEETLDAEEAEQAHDADGTEDLGCLGVRLA
mmetsp:Transcript_56494/g.156207  ORF Transcript_56494/g.156207 Transcript_56494/m.156207 type:complete len:229 (-) Transcript_56494:322-1008(-)